MSEDIKKALSRAKIGLMQKPQSSFISVLCCNLKTIISTEVNTAATDGESLYINPDFFLSLNLEERIALLAHETLHVAYQHPYRRGERDHKKWNVAGDYVINGFLKDKGYTLPSNGLIDRKYTGLSADQVYDIIGDDKAPDHEDLLPPPGNTPEKQQVIEAAVAGKIAQAAMSADMSKDPGSVPQDVRRFLEELRKPKVNWRAVLQRFLSDLTPSDYSWKSPNKRYLPNYLPRLKTETLGRIDFAIDTSGSVSDKQFNQLLSEIWTVLRMFNPNEIGVYQFDSVLQGSSVVKNLKDFSTIKFSGGGGTNVLPALEEFEANKAQALIVLSDGYFSTRHLQKPKNPVIWAIYDNPGFKPPFGSVIHFKFGD